MLVGKPGKALFNLKRNKGLYFLGTLPERVGYTAARGQRRFVLWYLVSHCAPCCVCSCCGYCFWFDVSGDQLHRQRENKKARSFSARAKPTAAGGSDTGFGELLAWEVMLNSPQMGGAPYRAMLAFPHTSHERAHHERIEIGNKQPGCGRSRNEASTHSGYPPNPKQIEAHKGFHRNGRGQRSADNFFLKARRILRGIPGIAEVLGRDNFRLKTTRLAVSAKCNAKARLLADRLRSGGKELGEFIAALRDRLEVMYQPKS